MLSTTSVEPYKLQEVIKAISANGNFGTVTAGTVNAGTGNAIHFDIRSMGDDPAQVTEKAAFLVPR